MDTKKTTGASKTPAIDLSQFIRLVEDKAYDVFMARQKAGKPGDALSDWLKAEKEIRKQYKLQ